MMPCTLKSSSRSSQWMPAPLPMSRQLDRSCGLACSSLGYHPRGTEMLLPSERSTDRVSTLISTLVIDGTSISTAKVVIPSLHKIVLIFFDTTTNSSQFKAIEPSAGVQADRVYPEFGNAVITLDMNVWGFVAISRIKEEAIWSSSKQCRHRISLSLHICAANE